MIFVKDSVVVEKKEMKYTDYEEFLRDNRKTVNRLLNRIMLFFVITGPAIALGIKGNMFNDITYFACAMISIYVLIMAYVHYLLLKRWPYSIWTSFFALMALNILLAWMTNAHVSILLTWFLVPLMSLFFCDKVLYILTIAVNFIIMSVSTWMTSDYYMNLRTDFDTSFKYFINVFGGYVIETVIMGAAGWGLGKMITGYFYALIDKYHQVKEHEEKMRSHMEILDSMAEIYDNVNLVDFKKMTEMSLRGKEYKKIDLDFSSQIQTAMNQRISEEIKPDQKEDFVNFTNITTVQARLHGKKSIYGEFVNRITGWFRAQYITVEADEDGVPTTVIYTIQNIDNDKRREEHLIRISFTDELTRLYNRRCYEEDAAIYSNKEIDEDLVIVSIDVNGLKVANDTKGHAAGDELIKGTADCLVAALGTMGKVYRTGGDEFMAIIHDYDCDSIRDIIRKRTDDWHGAYNEKLSISIGYAAIKDNPGADISELEKKADAMMYEEKRQHYQKSGNDRRASRR